MQVQSYRSPRCQSTAGSQTKGIPEGPVLPLCCSVWSHRRGSAHTEAEGCRGMDPRLCHDPQTGTSVKQGVNHAPQTYTLYAPAMFLLAWKRLLWGWSCLGLWLYPTLGGRTRRVSHATCLACWGLSQVGVPWVSPSLRPQAHAQATLHHERGPLNLPGPSLAEG